MAASRGSFLAQVDADDWLAPTAMARCLEVLADHPAVGMVYSRFCAVDAAGEPPSRHLVGLAWKPIGHCSSTC